MNLWNPPAAPLADLIALLYEGCVEPAGSREWLRLLQHQLGAECAHAETRHVASGESLEVHVSAEGEALQSFASLYTARWAAQDPFAAVLFESAAGEVHTCQQHFDEAFVASSEIYQQLLLPRGLRWAIGAAVRHGDCTTLIIARAKAPFAPVAAGMLRELLPHFERSSAMRIRVQRQARHAEAAFALLRELPAAYMLTDAQGRCIDSNPAFRKAAAQLGLRLVMGRARFRRADQQDQWDQALADTLRVCTEHTVLTMSADGAPCNIRLRPWQMAAEAPGAQAPQLVLALFDLRPMPEQANPDLLSHRIRLTPAELEVFSAMLQGLPAKAIANERGASLHTVRSQIKTVLEKTGFHSQRALIASFGVSGFHDSRAFRHSSGSHPANA